VAETGLIVHFGILKQVIVIHAESDSVINLFAVFNYRHLFDHLIISYESVNRKEDHKNSAYNFKRTDCGVYIWASCGDSRKCNDRSVDHLSHCYPLWFLDVEGAFD
jgi:hypothetical protein